MIALAFTRFVSFLSILRRSSRSSAQLHNNKHFDDLVGNSLPRRIQRRLGTIVYARSARYDNTSEWSNFLNFPSVFGFSCSYFFSSPFRTFSFTRRFEQTLHRHWHDLLYQIYILEACTLHPFTHSMQKDVPIRRFCQRQCYDCPKNSRQLKKVSQKAHEKA